MSASQLWLSLASGAPGLGGPYLIETLAAYEELDAVGHEKPQFLMAIGRTTKRQVFTKSFPLLSGRGQSGAVTLSTLGSPLTFLIDCELHASRDAPRIQGGPIKGDYARYEMRCAANSQKEVAYSLYHQLLASFSAVVLVFVEDFSSTSEVTDLLIDWLRSAMNKSPPYSPKIVLVTEAGASLHLRDFLSRLVARTLSLLRLSDPLRAYTAAEIRDMIGSFLHLETMEAQAGTAFATSLSSLALRACRERHLSDIHFSALHWKTLVRDAMAQFTESPSLPLSLCQLARRANPLPDDLSEQLTRFLRATALEGMEQAEILASALSMNAYPPGMHGFPPAMVYSELYEDKVRRAVSDLVPARCDLAPQIRERFVALASHNLKVSVAFAAAHKAVLRRGQASWLSVKSQDTCLVCAVHTPTKTLDCRHRLCNACTVICGALEGQGTIAVLQCPLCGLPNAASFKLRPPTAGIRVLDLGGVEAAKTMEFLRSIHRSISLIGNSLSDSFDVVLASNVGIFFALALFLEKWTLEDCKHHLRRLVRPKQSWIRSWNGTINFGKALKWELRDVRSVNQPALVIHTKRKLLSNAMAQSEADSTSLVELQRQYGRRCDCLVQYNGGPISRVLVKQMTNQLISSLFYVELAATPTFYRSPHACELALRCRLAPGAALFGLLLRLCRGEAHFLYRGDELEYKRIRVCEEKDLKAYQNWASYERSLQVQAVSPACKIDIQIDGDGIDKGQHNTSHYISNCPYRLEDLIRDQGLHRCFGSPDHRPVSGRPAMSTQARLGPHSAAPVDMEESSILQQLNALQCTFGQVMQSQQRFQDGLTTES